MNGSEHFQARLFTTTSSVHPPIKSRARRRSSSCTSFLKPKVRGISGQTYQYARLLAEPPHETCGRSSATLRAHLYVSSAGCLVPQDMQKVET
eukprot:6301959-Amphidinium_carterae.1